MIFAEVNFIQVMLTHVVFCHHCHFDNYLFIYFLNTNKGNLYALAIVVLTASFAIIQHVYRF